MDHSVSIVLPTHNRAEFVVRALKSVLSQTKNDDEIIVVDDGSTDNIADVLSPYRTQIRYVLQPQGGAGRARNQGIDLARNPLVAFIDSDDEWMSDSLEIRRNFMNDNKEVLFCFTDFMSQNADGISTHQYSAEWLRNTGNAEKLPSLYGYTSRFSPFADTSIPSIGVTIGNFYSDFIHGGYVNVNTLLVRRERVGDAFHFAEDLPTWEDFECVARLAKVGLGAFLDCETAIQHNHKEPRLTDANQYQVCFCRTTIMERIWGSDDEFLAKNAAIYQSILNREYGARFKWSLRHGHMDVARRELEAMEESPLSYRLLCMLPGFVVRSGLSLRDRIKRR